MWRRWVAQRELGGDPYLVAGHVPLASAPRGAPQTSSAVHRPGPPQVDPAQGLASAGDRADETSALPVRRKGSDGLKRLQAITVRMMKAHRWQQAQQVWTEWMRCRNLSAQPEAEEARQMSSES